MQIGDIVFEISNGQINNIGRTVLISNRLLGLFDKPVMCASFAKLIRVNEKVSPEFFYLYLNEGQKNVISKRRTKERTALPIQIK
jgi:type I restriction enzyme S subunit